jgi:hypothetical protein
MSAAGLRCTVILGAIFLRLKKTPIADLGRSRLRGSLAAVQMTGIGAGRASIRVWCPSLAAVFLERRRTGHAIPVDRGGGWRS